MKKGQVNQDVRVLIKKKNKKVQKKYYEILKFFLEQEDSEPQKVQGNMFTSFNHNYFGKKQVPYHYTPYTPNTYDIHKESNKWIIGERSYGSGGSFGFVIKKEDWGNHKYGRDWILQQERRNQHNTIFNPGQLPGISENTLEEEQVIYIEPSISEKKLEELRIKGQPFYDVDFPAALSSLEGPYGPLEEWQPIKWKQISDVLKKSQVFQGKIQPNDIKQGFLGDCYFLAALAALAERPDRIFDLFLLKKVNELYYYSLKMIYRGKWRTIDLDEYVPCVFGQPAFSKSNENQLWVILLEKAWAKMYGSYKQIQAGFPEEGLHDLTGAPIKNIYFRRSSFDREETWQYLLKASKLEYSMVASSNPGSDTNKSASGIAQGHAYTFLDANYLDYGNQRVRLVKLRNPWGSGQFKGRWSDSDRGWNYIPSYQKERLEYDPNKKDGTFFMTYQDFLDEFRSLTVAQINDNASYVYKSIHDPDSKGVYFKVNIVHPGTYSFQIDNTPQRSFTGEAQNRYRYPNTWIDIGKLEETHTKRLQGYVARKRTMFKSYDLMPGTYVVNVKIEFNHEFEKDFEVTLAIYSETACGISVATKNDVSMFKGSVNHDWDDQMVGGGKRPCYHFGKTCSRSKANKKEDKKYDEKKQEDSSRKRQNRSDHQSPYKESRKLSEGHSLSFTDTPAYSEQGNIVLHKGKIVRKIQTNTTQIQTTEESPNGKTIITTEVTQNKKETISSMHDDGHVQTKTIDTLKTTQATEKQLNGETLNVEEKFKERIETEEEKPTGEILRKVITKEGNKQTVEEESEEFEDEESEQADQSKNIVNISNSRWQLSDEDDISEGEKEQVLKWMQRKKFGDGSKKYTVHQEPSRSASEVFSERSV